MKLGSGWQRTHLIDNHFCVRWRTDRQSIGWISRPLPDSKDLQSLLKCLVKGERNKENDYNNLFASGDIDRELKNLLSKHRKEAEANLVYFQSALKSLEQKS